MNFRNSLLIRMFASFLVAALASPASIAQQAQPAPSVTPPSLYGDEHLNGRAHDALAEQEKKEEKKDEKKDEKKEEKKGLALKSERKVEFTTDEGTWLSLDVSPDGSTIVFELLGDLYTLPIAGGDAKRMAISDSANKDGNTMAFDSQPKFSPDGKWIAFLSDRDGAENVWIMKSDGTDPKKLSKDTSAEFASPAWTPDGSYVLVSRSAWGLNVNEIWMYHVKGGSGVQITRGKPTPTTPTPQRTNSLGVVCSPDGKYIYYSRRTGGFAYNAQFPLWQVARRDRVTGDEDILTAEYGSGIRPIISPDGKTLVYGTRYETQTGLRIRDLTTGVDKWLKYPITRDDQESRFTRDLLPGYTFLPGGKEILYTNNGKIQRLSIESGAETNIPFTAKVSQELGAKLYFPERVNEGPVRSRIIQNPTQSPDGRRIAFSTLSEIYTMDLPGGKPMKVSGVTGRAFQPSWSPDGEWLAYVTWTVDGGHVWKVPARGGSPQQLTRVRAFYTDPTWSPDGSRIVLLRASRDARVRSPFDGGQFPAQDVIWIPSSGGDANLVIPSRGIGTPHFGPEKDRIYFYSQAGLMSLRFDGTDRRIHLRVTGPGLYFAEEPVPADDIRISPDGQWVLAHVSNQLYVAARPQMGADAPTINIKGANLPVKQISDIGADYFDWADGGKTMTWSIGSTYFREPFSAVSFEPPKPEEKKPDAKPADGQEKKEEPKKEEAKQEEKKLYESFEVVIEKPFAKPQGSIVLRGAKVITMKGDEVIENADLVITDNRIAGVGARGKVTIPAGAKIMDAKGMTITPGFIDTHAHWFEIRRGILDLQNWSFLANLAYGVTAGLDVQTSTNDMFAYQDLVDTGDILGPRAYSTGPGVFSDNAFSTLDEVKNVLNRYKKFYRTPHIKSYIVGNRKQRQLVVEASKEVGIMPTTEGGLDLKLDLTHLLDGMKGNEHSLPIVPLYKDIIELHAKSGIFYTPTLIVNYGGPFGENYYYTNTEVYDDAKLNRFTPRNIILQKTERKQWFRKDQYAYPKTAEGATRILRAGGKLGVGSHGQLQGLGYHWELWMMASGGLTPMETLRVATIGGAEALGLAQDLGSIEPGKLADLVVMMKDPLADIKNSNTIKWVMKNGELFEGDTLNQVWPREKKLEPLWWWNEKPLK
jgi:Tol biopolymer transport system component